MSPFLWLEKIDLLIYDFGIVNRMLGPEPIYRPEPVIVTRSSDRLAFLFLILFLVNPFQLAPEGTLPLRLLGDL